MKIFVTGIGTDVGKTIASSIITESLQADYGNPSKPEIWTIQTVINTTTSVMIKR
jgi:hypothetical protein